MTLLVRNWVDKDISCHLRSKQLNPVLSVIYVKREVLLYFYPRGVCRLKRYQCQHGRLWGFI